MGDLKSVLIVGGGIAGMSCAIALREHGISVDLIDADPEWRVYGAGISITGATFRALRRLGLLDDVVKDGGHAGGMKLYDFSGQLLDDGTIPELEPGLPSVGGIMRPLLHRIMSERVKQNGTVIRLGVRAEELDQHPNGVDVTFSDGSSGSYDLVVGADGIYSATRAKVFPDAIQPKYTGQCSWRVVVDRPADMDKAMLYLGHENLFGMSMVSETQSYAFLLNPEAGPVRLEESQLYDRLMQLLEGFGGHAAKVREEVTPQSTIVYRPLESALQPLPWHVGRVVLIGDAAHATTPHLASGAGSAIEDGIVLAEEIAKPGQELAAALVAFEQRRFDRCKTVVETSVAIGRVQLEKGPPQEVGRLMHIAVQAMSAPI